MRVSYGCRVGPSTHLLLVQLVHMLAQARGAGAMHRYLEKKA